MAHITSSIIIMQMHIKTIIPTAATIPIVKYSLCSLLIIIRDEVCARICPAESWSDEVFIDILDVCVKIY